MSTPTPTRANVASSRRRRYPWVSVVVVAGLLASVVPSGCAGLARKSNYYSINQDGTRSTKYSRINQYTAYGAAIGAQAQVAAAYEEAQHAPAPSINVEVLNAQLPHGVTLENGAISIAPDAGLEAIGRFELGYWLDSAPPESEVLEDLHRLAQVLGATTLSVEIDHVAHGDPRVNYIVGIALRRTDAGVATAPALTGAAPPSTTGGPVTAVLRYQAPPRSCLASDEIADEISARLGYSPWHPSVGMAIAIEIEPAADGFRGSVTIGDNSPRPISGRSCTATTGAAVAIVLAALDAP